MIRLLFILFFTSFVGHSQLIDPYRYAPAETTVTDRILIAVQDAEQNGSTMILNSSLEIGDKICGWVFDISIPDNATITLAEMELYALVTDSGAVTVDIDVDEGSGTAPSNFTSTANELSDIDGTETKTSWTPSSWTINNTYTTVNFASSLQEAVDAVSGDMTRVRIRMTNTSGTGERIAAHGSDANSALLRITYQ